MTAAFSFRLSPARHPRPFPGGTAADPYGFARLLMDGAHERIEAAREHLVNGEQPERLLLQAAVVIISELRNDLDLPRGGAFAANLDDLYDYMCRRLRAVDFQVNGIAALDEVSHLLDALQSAWTYLPAEVRVASRN